VLIVSKAICGPHSSGLRWPERLADVLRSIGFFPSKAEKDDWMHNKGNHCEHIAAHADDLMIASRTPPVIVTALVDEHNFKLKGTGPTEFHLGCDFYRDKQGVLCYAAKKCIEKILNNYRRIYGTWPKLTLSLLVNGDHPELDTLEPLNKNDHKIYQSRIGALQWVIQIGCFDITTAVMTLSPVWAMPRQGHLDHVKRIHGYLSEMHQATINIRTDTPDFSAIPVKMYDWECSCYADAEEETPHDSPKPKGKSINVTSYFDTNLYHDVISGKTATDILHLSNQTPIDWFSKLQSAVKTATFGSKCVTARTCVEQIIDLHLTLCYLGAPINRRTVVFGDNESVVNSGAVPHSKMHKRWVALFYHQVTWAVAAGLINVHHISSKENLVDVLSKHWDLPSVWEMLKPLLFWHEGDNQKSQEELKEVNKDEAVDKMASGNDANSNGKTASQKNGDSN